MKGGALVDEQDIQRNLDEHGKEIDKLWDAHDRLKEEQIRLREHMTARFDSQDRRITETKEELRREIQAGDANNARRHNELKESIVQTLSGLAASNPVYVTFVITTVVAGLAVLVTWLVVK